MNTLLKPFIILLISAIQLNCSKEPQEAFVFSFDGTIGNQEFHFSNNSIVFESTMDLNTGEILYGQRSNFGNPVPPGRGIGFYFYFDEKPTFEKIKQLNGQEILESIEEKPLLRIKVFDNGELYESDFGDSSNDIFQIEEVKIATGERINNPAFDVGDVIALKGYTKIISDNIEIEGDFTLKLAEIN